MTTLSVVKKVCVVLLLWAATAIASGQTFATLVAFNGSNGSTPQG